MIQDYCRLEFAVNDTHDRVEHLSHRDSQIPKKLPLIGCTKSASRTSTLQGTTHRHQSSRSAGSPARRRANDSQGYPHAICPFPLPHPMSFHPHLRKTKSNTACLDCSLESNSPRWLSNMQYSNRTGLQKPFERVVHRFRYSDIIHR